MMEAVIGFIAILLGCILIFYRDYSTKFTENQTILVSTFFIVVGLAIILSDRRKKVR